MKNKHFEKLRHLAKQCQRRARTHYACGGIEVRYEFEGHDALTWWTHTSFVLNDYCVELGFHHPRCAYRTKIDRLAKANVAHLEHLNPDWLSDANATPIYRPVGRSRKKVVGHRQIGSICSDEWTDALQAEKARLAQQADFSIAPSIGSKWTPWSRRVTLCAPMPMRNDADLLAIVRLTKRLLKRETALEQEFPGYVYTREDWLRDNQATEAAGK